MAGKQKRVIKGWATVEIKDGEGELIPMDILQDVMPIALERAAPITLNHGTDIIVGKLTDYEFKYNTAEGADGLYITCEIFDNYPTDNETWDKIDTDAQGQDMEKISQFSIAGQYKLDENGTAEWIAPMTIAVTEKGMNQGADIVEKTLEKDGETMTEDEKTIPEKKQEGEEIKKEEDPNLQKAPGTEQKQDPAIFASKEDHDMLAKAVEEQGTRLQKIEGMLDSLMEDEEKEQGVDGAIESKEGMGKEEKPEDKKEDILAQHSKLITELQKENKELKAQHAKMLETGTRRTIPSAGQAQAPDPMDETLKRMGI